MTEKSKDAAQFPLRIQLRFFHFGNPLLAHFGKDFFAKIPRLPGVYFMKDGLGNLLYVGKAKDLRARIRSYTYAHDDNVSRKVLRLIHTVKVIEWELAEDEQSALLRENFFLRNHRPSFNVLNTTPHTYLFAHTKLQKQGVQFHLGMQEDRNYADIYGSFKSISLTIRAQKALLRLLWASFYDCTSEFDFPTYLTNRRKLEHFVFPLPDSLEMPLRLKFYRSLKRFFNGTSKVLFTDVIEPLLSRENLAPFLKVFLEQDVATVQKFYQYCARKNRQIRRQFKTDSKVIPQNMMDDFLVMLRS